MSSSANPHERPAIPDDINEDEVLAIVTVHHARAQEANQDIPHATRPILPGWNVSGIHVFLRQLNGSPSFIIGRQISDERVLRGVRAEHDIYLPDSTVGMRQCVLQPVPEQNLWRLHSTSNIVATVNGAPIRDYKPTSKRQPNPLPKALYLKQSGVNTVTVKTMHFNIWLLKSAQEACRPGNFYPSMIPANVQDVTNRSEQWARNRYDMTEEQVSTKTFRVINRYTGDKETAKVFRKGQHSQQLRNAELLLMSKADIDASIVRYRQSTEIETMPAIITDTYDGLATYESLRGDIYRSHPDLRFEVASKLVRRLFSALTWMHFNGIIHGGVSNDSVLLRIFDGKLYQVLLVDYSTAHPFVSGEMVPLEEMVNDGRAAMQLIEDCCDIWALRNGPPTTATAENVMRQRTQDLLNKHEAVKRVFEDYTRKGNSANDSKGKKLAKLQDMLKYSWKSAHDKETQNRAAREVAMVRKSKIDAMVQEWEYVHPPQLSIYKPYMLLSLGHPYIDSLANYLYVGRWDITPHEICNKLRQVGGYTEEPWQTFKVHRLTPIGRHGTGYYENHIMMWLATCCEVFPEWRQAFEECCQTRLHPVDGIIPQAELLLLRDALLALDVLPGPISIMFELLASADTIPQQVEEAYQIWYHIPSRLFNLTQLQRLATPERLATTITGSQIRCNNFVEVRGDPKIEGCYASLVFLEGFVAQFGLELPQAPNLNFTRPTFDPSDFSEIPQSRIVLARPGMLGYGSMLRTGDQANFLFSRTPTCFETLSTFIPTNFGDMKVLPKLPQDVRTHARPEHWSKYRTAEEFEAQADLSSRVIRQPVSRKARPGAASSSALPDVMEVDKFTLGQILRERERERVRAEARPPAKRDADALSSKPEKSSPKRLKAVDIPVKSNSSKLHNMPNITQSFVERAEARMQERPKSRPTPGHPSVPTHGAGPPFMSRASFSMNNGAMMDPGVSMTDVADDDGLEDDWALVNKMLENVNEDDDPEVQGITGFQIHDFDASMMDLDQPVAVSTSHVSKGKGKAVTTGTAPSPTSAQRPPSTLQLFSANQRPKSGLSQSFRYSPPGSPGPSTQSPSKTIGDPPATSFLKKHQRQVSNQSNGEDMPDTRPASPAAPSPRQAGTQQPTGLTVPEQALDPTTPINFDAPMSPSLRPLPTYAQSYGGLTQFFQASFQSSDEDGNLGTSSSMPSTRPGLAGNTVEHLLTTPPNSTQPFDPTQSFGPFGRGRGAPTQVNTPRPGSCVPMGAHAPTPPISSTHPFSVRGGPGSPTQANTPLSSGSGPFNNAASGPGHGNPLLGTPRRASRLFQDIGGAPEAGDKDMPDTDGEDE